MRTVLLCILAGAAVAACSSEQAPVPEAETQGGAKVASSGKLPVELTRVPPAVLAAAKAAKPDLIVEEAESETRDGRNYFDIEGRLADGSEIELDLLEENGAWRVVETQRDIGFQAVPAPVRARFEEVPDSFTPARIIESRQADGLVIYELFGSARGGEEPRKVEVKFDGKAAELLTREWAH